MKKQALILALAAAFSSAGAMAVDVPQGGAIEPADCATIGEAITINLSTGVVGAYSCNEAANAAAVATCHQNGSRKTQVYGCVSTDSGDDGVAGNDDDTWNDASCPAGDGSADDGEFTITADYKGFVASTTGGGVASQALQGSCESGTVNGLLPY